MLKTMAFIVWFLEGWRFDSEPLTTCQSVLMSINAEVYTTTEHTAPPPLALPIIMERCCLCRCDSYENVLESTSISFCCILKMNSSKDVFFNGRGERDAFLSKLINKALCPQNLGGQHSEDTKNDDPMISK